MNLRNSLQRLRQAFGRSRRHRLARRSLLLERLEDRTVPTVLFEPNPAKTIVDLGGPVLTNARVLLIYWGAAWKDANGNPIQMATNIQDGIDSILNNSPYMSRLAQYRGIGNATHPATFYINTTPPNPFTVRNVEQMLAVNLLNGMLPPPTDPQYLYYVVTPPNVNNGQGYGGFHYYGKYFGAKVHYGFGTIPSYLTTDPARLDFATVIFTHELVEAASDPEVNGFSVFPGGGANELCDKNAQLYTYRLNGYLTQSYWSQFDHAFVVPDGNLQKLVVRDSVSRVLFVNGDQLANKNDIVTLDVGLGGGVQVTLNGEVFQFDPNVFLIGGANVKATAVSTGTGTNTVTINKTPANVSTVVNMLAGTNDTLVVGNGLLDNILGQVHAYGRASSVNVVFDDQDNPVPGDTYTITSGTVTRTGGINFWYKNVRSLTLNVGTGNDTVTIASTAANTPTQVNIPQNIPGLLDTVNLGAATNGSLDLLRTPPTGTFNPANLDLVFNDQANRRNNVYTVKNGSLTRTGVRQVAFTFGAVHSLTLNTGRGNDTIDFQDINPATPLATVNGGTGQATVKISTNPISTAQVQFVNIRNMQITGGILTVVNNLTVQNLTVSAGTLKLAGGAVTAAGGLTIQNGGTLSGNGTLTANVSNSGRLSPGVPSMAAGLITVNGNYTQTANGALNIDIGGLAANQFDRLAITGAANLDGTLNVALINGFTPALNNSFQILTFANRVGDFAVKNGLNLGANKFDPQYHPTDLTLVVVMTNAGAFREFASPLPGSVPLGIAAGPDGNLWFTEQGTNTIGVQSPNGVVVHHYPVPTLNSRVLDIVAGPDGNLWFTEQSANQVGVITPAGVVLHEYPVGGAPTFMTVGPDGNLWFAEELGGKIGRLTPGGTLTEFATTGDPIGITVAPDGNLWFTEFFANKIGRMAPNGTGLVEFAVPTPNSEPLGIARGPDGKIWFTEYNGNNIGTLNVNGTGLTEYPIPTPGAGSQSIVAGPDGNLWFTETGNFVYQDVLGSITPAGVITERHTPTPASAPVKVIVGPGGNDLWFTEAGVDQIGQFTPGPGAAGDPNGPAGSSGIRVVPASEAVRVAPPESHPQPADSSMLATTSNAAAGDTGATLGNSQDQAVAADQLFLDHSNWDLVLS
jgi:virginiamycin B lyase